MNCGPSKPSGAAAGGKASRHNGALPLKYGSCWSRSADHQEAATASVRRSPPRRAVAAFTAELAPERRTCSLPASQAVAETGRGCPAHPVTNAKPASSVHSCTSVVSAKGTGKTLSDTSVMAPSTPNEPAKTRERS